jgi:fructose-bisphosphate aldolase class II
MAMTLREILTRAQADGVAIGHFNVSDLVLLKAVFAAARQLQVPVIVGASEAERAFVGVRQLAAWVRSLREEFDYPIFLNADHTHSLAGAVEAARAGFDSVVFDLSALPFAENLQQTQRAVETLRSISPAIIIEGEIGNIGSGSEIHDNVPASALDLTSVGDAKHFVESTGVDVLAPAVGSSHGMTRSVADGHARKHLDLARIRDIKAATNVFMTLHGASGTQDEDLTNSIRAGINIIHINTELRIAWKQGLLNGLARADHELAAYKILPAAVDSVQAVVSARLRLFTGRGQE